jgi:hypothetical protein
MTNKMPVQLEMWYRSLNRARLVAEKSGVFAKSQRRQSQVAIEAKSIQTIANDW